LSVCLSFPPSTPPSTPPSHLHPYLYPYTIHPSVHTSIHPAIYSFIHPVAAGPPWGSARELSLSPLTRRGDPPPSWPRGGWRHHAIFLEYSWDYCNVAATGNGWF
jgi:hypothetical protein